MLPALLLCAALGASAAAGAAGPCPHPPCAGVPLTYNFNRQTPEGGPVESAGLDQGIFFSTPQNGTGSFTLTRRAGQSASGAPAVLVTTPCSLAPATMTAVGFPTFKLDSIFYKTPAGAAPAVLLAGTQGGGAPDLLRLLPYAKDWTKVTFTGWERLTVLAFRFFGSGEDAFELDDITITPAA